MEQEKSSEVVDLRYFRIEREDESSSRSVVRDSTQEIVDEQKISKRLKTIDCRTKKPNTRITEYTSCFMLSEYFVNIIVYVVNIYIVLNRKLISHFSDYIRCEK